MFRASSTALDLRSPTRHARLVDFNMSIVRQGSDLRLSPRSSPRPLLSSLHGPRIAPGALAATLRPSATLYASTFGDGNSERHRQSRLEAETERRSGVPSGSGFTGKRIPGEKVAPRTPA